MSTRTRTIDRDLIEDVRISLTSHEAVRMSFVGGGRLYVERQVPFLIVHRMRADDHDPGTRLFALGHAAHLVVPPDADLQEDVRGLVRTVVEVLAEAFAGFLLIELWAGDTLHGDPSQTPPGFRIVSSRASVQSPAGVRLSDALRRIRIAGRGADVETEVDAAPAPPGCPPLLAVEEADRFGCRTVGLEVRPIHRDLATGGPYPLVARQLQHQLTYALLQACFRFAHDHTPARPAHYHVLGRHAPTQTAWTVDHELATIADRFDHVLDMTPTNVDQAFETFRRRRYEHAPRFDYRPLEADPAELKRRLHTVRIDEVEDPALAYLFTEKQHELDLQLSLLLKRGTDRALPLSIALYGPVEDDLIAEARRLLDTLPARRRAPRAGRVHAADFAARAEKELARYRDQQPDLDTTVEVRDDVSGLIVSHGHLLVGATFEVTAHRAAALLQHEVGTHVVTRANGHAQPLGLLSAGLPGAETLQEGLAVLAEHLANGLDPPRLRRLAARAVAAHMTADGARFVDVFRALSDWELPRRTSFVTTMRVQRGGGFVKDAIYLRGLRQVLDHLGRGGDLDALTIGKIALDHLALTQELRRRRILTRPPLRPRYLDGPAAAAKLEDLRTSPTLEHLADAVDG